jgi:E3 ubiquitin-protein ligase mind-bomb
VAKVVDAEVLKIGYLEMAEDCRNLKKRLDEAVKSLDEAVKKFDCRVCLNRTISVAFQCGHGTCSTCSMFVDLCPICRRSIQKKIKLYIC